MIIVAVLDSGVPKGGVVGLRVPTPCRARVENRPALPFAFGATVAVGDSMLVGDVAAATGALLGVLEVLGTLC